jgi:hypothetical protein
LLYAPSVPKKNKLPKWAIKQAGGINKKAWNLYRRGKKSGTRKGQVRKTARRAYTRRSNPKRSTMRRRKTFNIPLVQSVAGLAIANIAVKGITSSRLVDNPVATITAAGQNLMTNKDAVIKLGLGSLVAQFVATEVLRKRTIGSIGPIKLKA